METWEWCSSILSTLAVIISLVSLVLTGVYQIKVLELKETSSGHTSTILELQNEMKKLKRGKHSHDHCLYDERLKIERTSTSEHTFTILELEHEVKNLKTGE